MHLVGRSALILGLLLVAAGSVRSDDNPRAVVARAVQVVGGETLLVRAQAFQFKVKGTLYINPVRGDQFTGEVFSQLPDRRKEIVQAQTQGNLVLLTEVLAGGKAWLKDDVHVHELSPAELADLKERAYASYVASLLPLLKGSGLSLEPLGEAKVQGRPAIRVKVVSAGHRDIKLYFDKADGFLVKVEQRRKDVMTGAESVWEELRSDYRELYSAAADEQALKAAKVATDDAALLEFLRKRTLTEAKYTQIKTLIRNLGDASFEVRAKAKEELTALGELAAGMLARVTNDPDAEVASGAQECLKAIGKASDTTLPRAVVRLLARKKPAGVAEVLLGYLPSSVDLNTAQELEAALAVVALRDGKPDKALEQALTDKDPIRRAAAAAALGRDDRAGQRLFLFGLTLPTKFVQLRDGKKDLEWEQLEVKIFNRFPENVFAKP
jgi:hypothetical protein